jgi:hypothetical protein
MAGLKLTGAEQEVVKGAFLDGFGTFDYGKFCVEFDNVKPSGYFESTADAPVPPAGPSSAFLSPLDGGSAGFYAPLSAQEGAALEGAMERVREYVRTRGLNLKVYFRDYDVSKRGVITVSRFQREMSSCLPLLHVDEVALITKAYITADGLDVRYMPFHNDTASEESARQHATDAVYGEEAAAAAAGAASAGGASAGFGGASVVGWVGCLLFFRCR